MARWSQVFFLLTLALVFARCHGGASDLREGFYLGKCRGFDVEAIVTGVVRDWFNTRDSTIAAALLRMQFHDCFVNGCDASILLNGMQSEKTAGPNLSVRGYDLIDKVKSALEGTCAGVVSCADIIIMATRDAVSLSGGGRYIVKTGRRDGMVSLAKNVNLPSPSISVPDCIKAFGAKGISITDMLYLMGGHTVGSTHCSLIMNRLYNFQNTGMPDPSMNATLLTELRARCPQNAAVDNAVNLDQNSTSSMTVDNSFHRQINQRRGIFQIDQQLAFDPQTKPTVDIIATASDFNTKFGNAMRNLGDIEVLTGIQGQIRRRCSSVNFPK